LSPYVAISRKLLRAKSDATLVVLVGEGSEGAFATIVERYRPALLRHCRSMLGSH
jgi:DNA-directed RNA polymerase specialized sigma24 family protein